MLLLLLHDLFMDFVFIILQTMNIMLREIFENLFILILIIDIGSYLFSIFILTFLNVYYNNYSIKYILYVIIRDYIFLFITQICHSLSPCDLFNELFIPLVIPTVK